MLDEITIKGYKSIQNLDSFKLGNLNVLIGANGAGKSNFVSFLKMLNSLMLGGFNKFVADNGGARDMLFHGSKPAEEIEFSSRFGMRGYRFELVPSPKDQFYIENESRYYSGSQLSDRWWNLGNAMDGESLIVNEAKGNGKDSINSRIVYDAICSWHVYHFHDSSKSSPMRFAEIVEDKKRLRGNGSNIGSVLLSMRNENPSCYKEIISTIRLVMPYFDDFILEPKQVGPKTTVDISWHQKGSDYPMLPYTFSDGTLRFIGLVTAFLQPNPPDTIIVDEPELGLHPAAISILSELVKSASRKTQVIIATQSPSFIDNFSCEDLIVVNRKDGASSFERLNDRDFSVWLEDYSLGELWEKNVIQGGPQHE